jgi:hypothetical protein
MSLDFYLHETFGSQRIKELFDIIREFPDSLSAIEVLMSPALPIEKIRSILHLSGSFSPPLPIQNKKGFEALLGKDTAASRISS